MFYFKQSKSFRQGVVLSTPPPTQSKPLKILLQLVLKVFMLANIALTSLLWGMQINVKNMGIQCLKTFLVIIEHQHRFYKRPDCAQKSYEIF